MSKISLKEKVALITGAGGALGRSHALCLATLGAKIIVNDVGGSVSGVGQDRTNAEETASLIRSMGGEAFVDNSSVETMQGAHAMVATALKQYGRLDIVINNAGILRDSSFLKQEDEAWDHVIRVHLTGSRNVTKAAWKIMCDQKFGRIVMTTSASGLYGNFGQSNYAAAKLGVVGLMNSLKEEGAKYNIKINAIAPIARSRMTESILPQEILERLDPRFISPVVAYFSSDECQVTGQCWAVGGGAIARDAIVESRGLFLQNLDVDFVASHLEEIIDLKESMPMENLAESTAHLFSLTNKV